MKKTIKITAISVASLLGAVIIAGLVAWGVMYQRPGFRFLMVMADVINPTEIVTREISIKVKNENIPMRVYGDIAQGEGRYYFFLHGFTPDSYKHPMIHKMAKAIHLATGRTIFIPKIRGSVFGGRKISEVTREIGDIYEVLYSQHRGSYHAFGACIAGTGLILSLRYVPEGEYPERFFLYGPFLSGEGLIKFYNNAGMKLDYMVKMANALFNKKDFSNKEHIKISNAMMAVKPGITDRERMKEILGYELYEKVENATIYHDDVISIDEDTLFASGKKLPGGEFYIIHSVGDHIIPFIQGQGLHRFLLQCGVKSKFLKTQIFGHTDKKLSLKIMLKETRELLDFLDELFRD